MFGILIGIVIGWSVHICIYLQYVVSSANRRHRIGRILCFLLLNGMLLNVRSRRNVMKAVNITHQVRKWMDHS